MVLDITGRITSVILISIIPTFTHMMTIAVISYNVYDGMSFYLSLTMGAVLSAGSTAILIFAVLGLRSNGFGVEKGIDKILIPGVILNTLLSMFSLVIFKNLALHQEGYSSESLLWKITLVLAQIAGGLLVGWTFGFLSKAFKKMPINIEIFLIFLLILGMLIVCYIRLIIPS